MRSPPPGPRCYGCWGAIDSPAGLTIYVCPTCFQISACVVPPEVEPFAVVAARSQTLGVSMFELRSVQEALVNRQTMIMAAARRWRGGPRV